MQKNLSVEENSVVDFVNRETILKDGHYEVPLPWKGNEENLPNNYELAKRRLEHLRARFFKDKKLFDKYSGVIIEYRNKGYIAKIPVEQQTNSHQIKWYLPHHPVLNAKKPDKLRVVFDFAAKFHGMSLNECLHQGPDMIADLVGVLLRFRLDYVAVVADIEEMFLQVRVPEKDRGALRFLWWSEDDYNKDVEEYQLTVHPFGATSSPFCANFALRRTIDQFGDEVDDTVKSAINRNFYVDDCLASLPSITVANRFVEQLRDVLQKGGFRLRKWISNERQVLDLIPDEERTETVVNINTDSLPSERTLGLEWDAEKDILRFRFRLPDKPATRREILSCVSSLFDPLGIVGPTILPIKCLLQELCKEKLGWDDVVDGKKRELWEQWVRYVNRIGEVCIPRCMKLDNNDIVLKPQLHIFCDACENGYGAVAYVRYVTKTGYAQCRIIFAKTRVTPLKTVTIPRLELTSAVLATRVYQIIKRELSMEF